MSITLERQIRTVQREIRLRLMVYPKWVAAKKMKPEAAEHEIAAMTAVLETLTKLHRVAVANASVQAGDAA